MWVLHRDMLNYRVLCMPTGNEEVFIHLQLRDNPLVYLFALYKQT